MQRSKILGGIALASMMLVVLTGCPSVIANIVGASESVQQAVDSASAGDTIKIMGSHDEDVSVDKDNITITSEDGGEIDGDVTVNGDNVTIEDITITGTLDTKPGSFNNLTLNNVTVGGWNNATVSGTFSCSDVVQSNEDVQPAIDNAPAGGSVCIAPFIHQEQLVINKDLSLIGINDPTIKAPSSPNSFTFAESGADWEPVIFAFGGTNSGGSVSGAGTVNVDIEGLTVDGNDQDPEDRAAGILLRNVNSPNSIANNRVKKMGVGSGDQTFGIVGYGDSDLRIVGNDVSGYTRLGIGVLGDFGPQADPKPAIIEDNTVTGPGPVTNWAPNGIEIAWGDGSTGTIRNNDVRDNRHEDGVGSGIILVNTSGVLIEGNRVEDNNHGIAIFGSGGQATATENIRNFIKGNDNGILPLGDSMDNVIEGNTITGNEDGVDVDGGPANVVANVQDNDIVGNTRAVDGNSFDSTVVIDMEGNYWGSANGPEDPDNGDNGQGGEGTEVPDCTSSPENERNTEPSGDLGNPIGDTDTSAIDYCPWENSSVSSAGLGVDAADLGDAPAQDEGDLPSIQDEELPPGEILDPAK